MNTDTPEIPRSASPGSYWDVWIVCGWVLGLVVGSVVVWVVG